MKEEDKHELVESPDRWHMTGVPMPIPDPARVRLFLSSIFSFVFFFVHHLAG